MIRELFRLIDGQVMWPYSVALLRMNEPAYGFSDAPSDEVLARFGVGWATVAERPEFDASTHRIEPEAPVQLEDGEWVRGWVEVELSQAKQDAIFRAQNPPEWQAFAMAVWAQPAIGAMLRGGLQMDATTPVSMALPVGLGQAAQDASYDTFLNAAQAAYHSGLLAVPLLAGIASLAVQYLLPEEFIGGIRSLLIAMPLVFQPPENPARFDQWTAPDGSVWVWDQPRDALGQYVVDDPETPESESALRWQLVLEVPE